jgi:protein involved in polysaccharide export with SLBB domain
VIGNVVSPGSYQVSSAGTVLTALYAAGGPAEMGSLRGVQVRRGGQTVTTLDLYDYLFDGDASHDTRLESGDVVFVPFHGRFVDIAGEVERPMIYEMREHETLADLACGRVQRTVVFAM